MHRNSIYLLLFTIAGLAALGIVMLFSTSAFALESHGDMFYFVKKQALMLALGLVVGTVAAFTDYHFWRRTWWVWFAAAILLLLLCFVPHVGLKINGAKRWIRLGFFVFQPSELAKAAGIFFVAWWYSKYEEESGSFLKGFVFPLAIIGVLVAPIAKEVDIGNTVLIVSVSIILMFVAGVGLRWLALMFAGGLAGVAYASLHIAERHERILAFMHPEKYGLSAGLQQLQALIAFGSGGVTGLGLGNGVQKLLYLPEAHTDFIFPMIGEELGLRFTLMTVGGYLLVCLCGSLIAANSRDRFGMLLGFGCVMMICLQAIINMGMTMSLLPNKGMPLPFISFGGSNILVCLFMVGILVNIHRHGKPLVGELTPALTHARISTRL